jgi:hypothetical protein
MNNLPSSRRGTEGTGGKMLPTAVASGSRRGHIHAHPHTVASVDFSIEYEKQRP